MPIQDQESRIILALEAIRSSKKISISQAATLYNVPKTTLRDRKNGKPSRRDLRLNCLVLDDVEEEVLCKYILDLDDRGFAPGLAGVKDMANLILNSRGGKRVGKHWAQRFVQRRQELKTRQSRAYNFQRALCENPEIIGAWVRLVENMRAKYGIQDGDLYNFDETGFMMGVICPNMVVTRSDRQGQSKSVQPANRERATAVVWVNSEG